MTIKWASMVRLGGQGTVKGMNGWAGEIGIVMWDPMVSGGCMHLHSIEALTLL